MSDTPNIDELRGHAKALVTLLDDPQPGLMTWRVALAQVLVQIAEFGPGEPATTDTFRMIDLPNLPLDR